MTPTTKRQRKPAPVSESLRLLGERIRRARIKVGLSQTQLGQPHFTRAYISAVELGKVRPAVKSLEFLSGQLGKPLSFFMADEAEEARLREREVDIAEAAALLTRSTAADALPRIESLLEGGTDPRELTQLHLMAGTALNYLIRGADSMRHLTTAERTAVQFRDTALQRSIRYQLAIAHRTSGDSRRGQTMLRDLLTEIESSAPVDRPLQMKVLKDLGAFALDLGESESAEAYYGAALTWANEIGDAASLISIYNGLGYAMRAKGDLDGALGYLQKALGASEIADDLFHITMIHNMLAVIAAERGHMEAALKHAEKAIAVSRVAGPRAFVASCLNTKAECAVKVGDLATARACANEALSIAIEVGNDRAVAAAKVVLADADNAEHPDDAERWLGEAAATYRTLEARAELGDVLMRLSRLARKRGDEAIASTYATEAYEATRQTSYLPRR